jgi:hypothetical protein
MVSQWQLEMNHVVRVVGGFTSQQKHIGQQGVRFVTVPKAKQSEAVRFLVANAFQTPMFMIQPDILRRIQASGVVDRVRTAQNSVLSNLLQAARLDRMVEQAALDGPVAYAPIQFLGDLRAGVWSELAKPAAPITIYRRNLHRSYLDTVDTRLNGQTPPSDEVRALLRGELRALDAEIRKALPLVTDEVSKRHLLDARDQIAQTLDPRAMRTRAPDPAAGRGGRGGVH